MSLSNNTVKISKSWQRFEFNVTSWPNKQEGMDLADSLSHTYIPTYKLFERFYPN